MQVGTINNTPPNYRVEAAWRIRLFLDMYCFTSIDGENPEQEMVCYTDGFGQTIRVEGLHANGGVDIHIAYSSRILGRSTKIVGSVYVDVLKICNELRRLISEHRLALEQLRGS